MASDSVLVMISPMTLIVTDLTGERKRACGHDRPSRRVVIVALLALLAFLGILRVVAQPRPDVGLAQPDRSFAAGLARVGTPQHEHVGGGPAVGDGGRARG